MGHSPPVALADRLTRQVFIVGMNGSGTTMLLDHLSSHPLLFGYPTETRFLPYFLERQAKYGDLEENRNYLKLWSDIRTYFVRQAAHDQVSISIPNNWQEQSRTAAGVFDQIMRTFAAAKGKQIWCEKTPMHALHLRSLADAFPGAKFIHIIRDGRDCAASFHRRWKFNPVRTVYRWKRAVKAGREQGQDVGSRYHEVRYEEVTKAPEHAFREICEFLGLPFEASVLSSSRSRPDMIGLSAKTVAPNRQRAASYFDSPQLARLEYVAGRYLTELGYECRDTVGDEDPPRFLLRWWEVTDDLRRLIAIALVQGRLLRPGNWRYVITRVRRTFKQKATQRH